MLFKNRKRRVIVSNSVNKYVNNLNSRQVIKIKSCHLVNGEVLTARCRGCARRIAKRLAARDLPGFVFVWVGMDFGNNRYLHPDIYKSCSICYPYAIDDYRKTRNQYYDKDEFDFSHILNEKLRIQAHNQAVAQWTWRKREPSEAPILRELERHTHNVCRVLGLYSNGLARPNIENDGFIFVSMLVREWHERTDAGEDLGGRMQFVREWLNNGHYLKDVARSKSSL